MKPRDRMRSRGLLGLLAVAAVMVVASCISNPGTFTITALEGSTLTVKDSGGVTKFSLDFTTPDCRDGIDNDLDGTTDGSDSACASANDANERLAGGQTRSLPNVPIDIDAVGVITGDPTDLDADPKEICVNTGSAIWCLAATVVGTGGTQTGSIDEETEEISIGLPIVVSLSPVVGFDGLGANCQIGPLTSTFLADDYDTVTGEATLSAIGVATPVSTGCGTYGAAVDLFAGLPGTANIVVPSTILDSNGDPIAFDS